jgi:hypothetical protein
MPEHEAEKMRMLESDVERYKTSAGMWRNHAYKMGGTPLPWDADELLQKAIEAEREACAELIPPQYFELRDRIRAREQ